MLTLRRERQTALSMHNGKQNNPSVFWGRCEITLVVWLKTDRDAWRKVHFQPLDAPKSKALSSKRQPFNIPRTKTAPFLPLKYKPKTADPRRIAVAWRFQSKISNIFASCLLRKLWNHFSIYIQLLSVCILVRFQNKKTTICLPFRIESFQAVMLEEENN